MPLISLSPLTSIVTTILRWFNNLLSTKARIETEQTKQIKQIQEILDETYTREEQREIMKRIRRLLRPSLESKTCR